MSRKKKETESFVLPTNPVELKSIRDAIYEIEGALAFIQDKKEFIKDVHSMLDEKYNMPKDIVTKMVKAHQDDMFDEMVSRNEEFEIVYEKVLISNLADVEDEEAAEE